MQAISESKFEHGLETFVDMVGCTFAHRRDFSLQKSLKSSFETISESPVAYITKAHLRKDPEHPPCWVAIKSASVRREFSKQPHDIVKELRLLRNTSNINVRGPYYFQRSHE